MQQSLHETVRICPNTADRILVVEDDDALSYALPRILAVEGHGLRQSAIVELVAMSGLAVNANIMADATAIEPNKMFASL